ncbi:STAS domain-containing protein [Asanoa sp. WMMD1127]|uniref:STAS domain-containing protein n=1 Tax=Asanoa sp. WMMD1127 TaxID=3016107 RepID=UPI002415D1E2|nr:STAS domain-containing protein [Asanoa sp. WMMD1127]MDG4821831.1 STAS domain-containing protein [Asanoa sp. WMMD1127]
MGVLVRISVAEAPTGGVTVVKLAGELGVDTAAQLASAIEELLDRPVNRIVIDLTLLGFCDSIGLSTFVDAHRRCAATGGYLALAAPSPFMHKLLGVVGLTRSVPTYATVASACANGEDGRLR